MSDSVAPETNAEPPETAESEAGATDWKAEARKWEDRAKANKAAADKAAGLADALQKAEESLAETVKRLSGYEAKEQHAVWVGEVLSEVGLPEAYGPALRGDSRDELLAHAEALKPLIKANVGTVPDAGKTPEHKTTPEREALRNLFGPK